MPAARAVRMPTPDAGSPLIWRILADGRRADRRGPRARRLRTVLFTEWVCGSARMLVPYGRP